MSLNSNRSSRGPPRLFEIAQLTLRRYKDLLGDIGNTPIDLIYPILATLTVEQLQTVEDETIASQPERANDFIPWTWPLWWRHCNTGLVARLTKDTPLPKGQQIPPLPDGGESLVGPPHIPPGVAPLNYRFLYMQRLQQIEDRKQQSKNKLKERAEQVKERKESRQIKVIDVQIRKKGKRPHSNPLPTTKERLTKKLGLPTNLPHNRTPSTELLMKAKRIRAPRALPTRSALAGIPPLLQPPSVGVVQRPHTIDRQVVGNQNQRHKAGGVGSKAPSASNAKIKNKGGAQRLNASKASVLVEDDLFS